MQDYIPIFDSNAHPTIGKKWNSKNLDSSFDALSSSISNTIIEWACAVGLDGLGEYNHDEYIRLCKQYSNLVPIAGFNPSKSKVNIEKELFHIVQLGYKGIKINPILSKFRLSDVDLNDTFQMCSEHGIPIFLCTYFFGGDTILDDNFRIIASLLSKNPNVKIILMHGGGVELLKYSELVRFYKNAFIDLSFTLFKYEKSSIENDIYYLFNYFDQKICIGTDFPEYNHNQLQLAFEKYSKGIDDTKKRNIAYKNLHRILSIEIE